VATANQATPQSFDLSLRPFTTYATVTQVFEERRDSGLLDFPCFEIDGRIAGGMSGGPVFNERGSLCGINCSSLQGADADLSYTSWIASLWPALGTPVEFEGPGLTCKGPYPLSELSTVGALTLDDRWVEFRTRVYLESNERGENRLRLRPPAN
jgi:hypothetical protein